MEQQKPIQNQQPGQLRQTGVGSPQQTMPYRPPVQSQPVPSVQSYQPPASDRSLWSTLHLKLIIPLALIVLLLVGIGIYLVLSSPEDLFVEPAGPIVSEQPIFIDEAPEEIPIETIENFTEVDWDTNFTLGVCENLSGSERDGCYREAAKELLVPDLCNYIADFDLSNICVNEVAVLEGSGDYCAILSVELQELCYMNVAQTNRSSRLCLNIGDIALRDTCLTNLGEDPDAFIAQFQGSVDCEGLSGTELDFCYMSLATKMGDTSQCDLVSGFTEEATRADCLYNYAIEMDDESACLKIEEVGTDLGRNFCLSTLTAIYNDNYYCDFITEEIEGYTKDDCIRVDLIIPEGVENGDEWEVDPETGEITILT